VPAVPHAQVLSDLDHDGSPVRIVSDGESSNNESVKYAFKGPKTQNQNLSIHQLY
jgi:hypothetical protein